MRLGFQAVDSRGARVDGVGHGEADASQIRRCGVHAFGSHVVQASFRDAGDKQRVTSVLGDVLHGRHVPVLNPCSGSDFGGLALDRLTQGQGHACGGLGQVFAEDEDGIVQLDVAQGRRWQRAVLQDVADQADIGQFASGDTAIEIVGTHQFAQGEIGFQAGARRANTDHTLALELLGGLVQRGVDADGLACQQRLTRAICVVDVAIAEAATVTEEVLVHRAVETVLDAAQLAVALAGADVAAAGATVTDARGELHVPLAVVTLGVGLVGEYAGRADLDQIAGELALQRAVLDAAEVHVVVRAIDAQVAAARVVLVVAHAAVAGNAAVHLVGDERAEFLVLVGTLGKAITTGVMPGHHRHVLQVAVTAFLAHRAVVRVVGHQPFDDTGAKCLGFLVVNADPGVVGGGCHAGHDDTTTGVVLVVVLLDRALAARADAAKRRVPAEVGDIESEGQAGLQEVVCPIDFEIFAVYVDSGHFFKSSFTRLLRRLAKGIRLFSSQSSVCGAWSPPGPHRPRTLHGNT
ncbi:conserved hypothetical protein [Pseudomonas sp. 8Z]|nr:conserved hypothetical protein [Pseudomonas sp. 8Z]